MNQSNESATQMLAERLKEQLRQQRETFDQHKLHEDRWFFLRLVMGYTAVVLLLSVLAVASYILLNNASFPTTVVVAAGATLFADILGVIASVWKIVLNRDFMTKLAPVTDLPESDGKHGYLTGSSQDELIIHSAIYGKADKTRDVTDVVKSRVSNGELEFLISNDLVENLGGDPAPQVVKELRVVYSYEGETRTVVVDEHQMFSLP